VKVYDGENSSDGNQNPYFDEIEQVSPQAKKSP